MILINYLANNGYNYDGSTGGDDDKIGKSLASTSGWFTGTNEGAVGNTDYPSYRNKSDFTALPGGAHKGDGSWHSAGNIGYFWGTTELAADFVWSRSLWDNGTGFGKTMSEKKDGHSIRCLKD